jgi:soluble lytic murein transglycosylase-like protein
VRRGSAAAFWAGLLAAFTVCAAFGNPAQEPLPEHVLITQLRTEGEAYEHGEGMPKDPERAAQTYCKAARLGDAQSQFNLGWMYANGRGVERSDATAAFFFAAAAEQGLQEAGPMLAMVGGPSSDVPACMQDPPSLVNLAQAKETRATAAAIEARAPKTIVDLVRKLSLEYRVQPQLALAVIEAESNFNVAALSPKNAKGLMQLIPATADRFGVRNPYDAAQNIRGGMAYLRWLLAYFEGDVLLVAAAYNAGEGAVDRYRGVPPYAETRDYVRKILKSTGSLTHPFEAAATAPSPQLAAMRGTSRIR